MRIIFSVIVFSLILFYGCTTSTRDNDEKAVDVAMNIPQDTFHLLCQYWKLDEADHPTSRDVSFTNEEGILFQSGIVFMTDSTALENPGGEMAYGKFKVRGDTVNVDFEHGRKAIYLISKLSKDSLNMQRIENGHTSELFFKATHTYWPDANENPFSKSNYQWSEKPKKPESDEALKKRLKDNVQFYAYYFNGVINGGADKFDFIALPCCLNWYQGGITIQSENKLDKKWANCFYSVEQAFKARQILEDVLLQKYDWDTTQTNWLKQTVLVLEQIHDRL